MSKIRLGEDFFNEIISCPVPLDMNILKALKRSSLGLDWYLWLPPTAPLPSVLHYGPPGGRSTGSSARTRPERRQEHSEPLPHGMLAGGLKKIKVSWPELNYATAKGVLILSPSKPAIPPADPSLRLGE